MPTCDLCGKEAKLYKAIVEGVELVVCEECGKHGKIIKVVEGPKVEEKKKIKEEVVKAEPEEIKEPEEIVVADYAGRIRRVREKWGLKQKEFAEKLNEKESLIHKLETGSFEPSIGLARKLERKLGIKLVEVVEEGESKTEKGKKVETTIGDMVKIKK